VENLRDGVPTRIDARAIRAAWDGQQLGALAPPPRKLTAVPGGVPAAHKAKPGHGT
jgi:hypothetical protein